MRFWPFFFPRRQRMYALLMAVSISVHIVSSVAAPITFNTALPIGQHEVIIGKQLTFSGVSGSGKGIDTVTAQTLAAYGLTAKWASLGATPVVYGNASSHSGAIDTFRQGDSIVFSRYEMFHFDGRGSTTRIAPLLGINLPTSHGSEEASFFGGLVTTIANTDFNFGTQFLYTEQHRNQDREIGGTTAFDASIQYRVWPHEMSTETSGFLFAVLETNMTHQRRARSVESNEPNTTETQWSISPGMQYVTQRWILDLALTIPVNGATIINAVEPEYRVLSGIRINF